MGELPLDINLLRVLSAELFATAMLVFLGCGAYVGASKGNVTESITMIALSFGFTYTALIHTFVHLSGAHVNPAVTLAFFVTKKIGPLQAFLYMLTQMIGAIVGAGILNAVTGSDELANLGVTTVATGTTNGEAFGLELVITFLFVITVFATVDPRRIQSGSLNMGPLHIGLVVAALHFFAVPFTGCSMNPARSFGPAVITNEWDDHWVYWVGPMAGGALGGLLYVLWFDPESSTVSLEDAYLGAKGKPAAVHPQVLPQRIMN